MVKRPSFQFYPADWRKDVALRMCSPAARGLWIDMLCIMHDAEPYGHLIAEGEPITPDELATIVGASSKDVKVWLAELAKRKVYSVTDAGVIYSRRMTRDEKDREEWRDRQVKSRARHSGVTPDVTSDVTLGVTPKSLRSSSSSSPSPSESIPEDKSSGRLAAPLPAQLPLEANGHKAGNHAGEKPPWWPIRDRYGRITSEITEKIVFDVGKAVLGKSSGGVITKARKAWSYKREDRDRTVLEFLLVADEKSDPPSWFAATLRKAEMDESPSAPHEQFPQNEYRA